MQDDLVPTLNYLLDLDIFAGVQQNQHLSVFWFISFPKKLAHFIKLLINFIFILDKMIQF